jgi:hypothetical protein
MTRGRVGKEGAMMLFDLVHKRPIDRGSRRLAAEAVSWLRLAGCRGAALDRARPHGRTVATEAPQEPREAADHRQDGATPRRPQVPVAARQPPPRRPARLSRGRAARRYADEPARGRCPCRGGLAARAARPGWREPVGGPAARGPTAIVRYARWADSPAPFHLLRFATVAGASVCPGFHPPRASAAAAGPPKATGARLRPCGGVSGYRRASL